MPVSLLMEESNKTDGLIFDLDGTLWDASATCAVAWNEALKQSGLEDHLWDEDKVRSFSGLRIEIILNRNFEFITGNKQQELLTIYKGREKHYMKILGGVLYPGLEEVLWELRKNYQLFIVSNCLAGYIENFIEFNQFEKLFTDFESSGNSGLEKSENIKRIVTRNQLQQPVYIGDTRWDLEAARKAGVPFIYAAYGFGEIENPDLKIEQLAELKELL